MFLEKECVETHSEEYMFIGCIEFINKVWLKYFSVESSCYCAFQHYNFLMFLMQVKTGQFAEHSNQLWNISAVPTWTKINSGLLKMYKAEVCLF